VVWVNLLEVYGQPLYQLGHEYARMYVCVLVDNEGDDDVGDDDDYHHHHIQRCRQQKCLKPTQKVLLPESNLKTSSRFER